MENQNIVITSLYSWDSEGATQIRNIAKEFSKKNQILFVNPAVDRLTKFRQRDEPWIQNRNAMRRGDIESIQKKSDSLCVYSPPSIIESIRQVNSESVFDALNRINNCRFARDISEAADSIGFREFALFCDSDIYNSYYLKEYLQPLLTVYYTHDDPKVKELRKHHGGRLEPVILKGANIVVCSSQYLTEQARMYNASSYLIGSFSKHFRLLDSNMAAEEQVENEFAKKDGMQNSVASIYKVIDDYQS